MEPPISLGNVMPTQLLAPATAAANTADQTITTGGSLTFGIYTAAGGIEPSETSDCLITRKDAAGTYMQTGVVLNAANPNQVITGAGIYRVEKPVTIAAIGVEVD